MRRQGFLNRAATGKIMNVIRRAVKAWFVIAMVARASISIPVGLALLVAAGWLVWRAGDSWIVDLLSAWLAYCGGTLIFSSLAEFTGETGNKEPVARHARRPAGR
jgi:hypothetical protein